MILTCPNCASRFLLAAQALAPNGRHVRCANCSETWFEEPDEEELFEEEDEGHEDDAREDDAQDVQEAEELEQPYIPPVEDIPEAVKPRPEEPPPAKAQVIKAPMSPKAQAMQSIALAALVFMLLCAPLLLFKSQIMHAWPESIAFYQAIGSAKSVPGEALVFDKILADIKDDSITISGQIINLTSKDKIMPLIEVAARDEQGHELSHWYIEPPQSVLKAEETLPLKAQYSFVSDKPIADIRMRFVLKAKTDAKTASITDDNTPAPHADDSAHSPGHGAAEESPPHGGAPPHQESSH